MALTLVTAPTSEPVLASEIETHGVYEQGMLASTHVDALITAAREYAESPGTERAFLTQTWDLTLDRFPECGALVIPRPPLQSVTYVKYYDTANTLQTWSSSLYYVDTNSTPGRISPAYGEYWPQTIDRMNAVVVRFVAGWTAANQVPESLKLGIKMLVLHWLDNREPIATDGRQPAEMPYAVRALLDRHAIGMMS